MKWDETRATTILFGLIKHRSACVCMCVCVYMSVCSVIKQMKIENGFV